MSDDGDDRVDGTDGMALALRLAAGVEAGERETDALAVVDEATGVEPTADGAFAYAIDRDETRLAEVAVHPDRIHVEFLTAPDRAAGAAADADLRVRPKAVRPPRTLVFVESPDEIEAALDVLDAVAGTLE
ncbi:hypothetical protein [Halosimplex amylolyticum]|uniref:hypothetical protein n=1 Tax=Halosimplex amylolyticum TaxID=3396616 RepID=UPI003F5525BA